MYLLYTANDYYGKWLDISVYCVRALLCTIFSSITLLYVQQIHCTELAWNFGTRKCVSNTCRRLIAEWKWNANEKEGNVCKIPDDSQFQRYATIKTSGCDDLFCWLKHRQSRLCCWPSYTMLTILQDWCIFHFLPWQILQHIWIKNSFLVVREIA